MMSLGEFFANHTFRMVFFGTAAIGMVAGALGPFAYLRKQSLVSDVASHAALPGTLGAFLIAVSLGFDGRTMLALIVGAIITSTMAVLFANSVSNHSKLKIDAAMAATLAAFFGFGMVLMRIIADGPFPGKGGIQDYLFGNASVITYADLVTSIAIGAIAVCMMLIFWKEFSLRTFDPVHSSMLGFRGSVLDALLFSTIVTATVIGVKSVGLVLMVAFIVTPPAAARQWVRRLPTMVMLSSAIGGASSAIGAYLSIAWGKMPTGPVIVLTLFLVLVVSLLAAPRRSLVVRAWRRRTARTRLLAEFRESAANHVDATPTTRNRTNRHEVAR